MYAEFKGIAKWAKLQAPDKKYNNYEVDLYVNDETAAAIKATGLQLKQREDKDGIFFKFRRPAQKLRKGGNVIQMGAPAVIKDGKRYAGEVGNGSEIAVLVSVYESPKGIAHTLECVRVERLVEYIKPEKPDGWDYDEDQPAFD